MVNLKLATGVGLSALALAFTLVVVVGGIPVVGTPEGMLLLGTSAIVMSIAAFVVSWKKEGSYVIAGLLGATGLASAVPTLLALISFPVIVFPGPLVGVIVGLAIFGLGVAKGIVAAKAKAQATATG